MFPVGLCSRIHALECQILLIDGEELSIGRGFDNTPLRRERTLEIFFVVV